MSTPNSIRNDDEMVRALIAASRSGPDGGMSGVRKALRLLKPTPAQFWRFIRELSAWSVRP